MTESRGTFSMPAHPGSSSPQLSVRMSARRRKDTEPEMLLRRALHRRGLRYRTHLRVAGLPRRSIDIAFPRQRIAVFVDGCFWHGCPEHGTWPTSNESWWAQKLATNQARDQDTTSRLTDLGWRVIRIWEHESVDGAVDRVRAALAAPGLGDAGS